MAWKAASFGIALSLAAAGYAMVPQAQTDQERRTACIARGGTPHPYGQGSTRWFCDEPFADAGKVCSATSDCIGRCMLPDGYVAVMGQKWPTKGTCQARTRIGCMNILQDGLPTRVCVD